MDDRCARMSASLGRLRPKPDDSIKNEGALKFLGQPSLLQNSIGRVPRSDMMIDYKVDAGDWTVPDLVIASSLSFETAAGFP
jgi:hypothetical protein